MARRGLWCQIERCLAGRSDWNRTFLRWERSWQEMICFLERKENRGRDRNGKRR
ncbi:MAG: hypothetical protein IKT45_05860 [Lachnospiraceae bacterium]|nr:hypothetical protein [Lachnospiraceae bacterium]